MFNGGGGGRRVRPLGGIDPEESDPSELDPDGDGLARGKPAAGTCRGNKNGRGDGVVRGNNVGGLMGPKPRGD